MSSVFNWDEQRHALGDGDMDRTHQEFIALVNQTARAGNDDFAPQLVLLQRHTQQHFEREEQLMQDCNFPASEEHKAEHQRILGELQQFTLRAQQGRTSLARAYVQESLPGWFHLHTATMDSALAAHLLTCRQNTSS